jgi:hypothetical protein
MSGVRVLVGTRKGAFILTADGARKNWNIAFESGKASFTPAAEEDLKKLLNDLVIASGTTVEIHHFGDLKQAAVWLRPTDPSKDACNPLIGCRTFFQRK